MILPKEHHISKLIIEDVLRRIKHQGRNHVLAELRQKYWIINARTAIRGILSKCIICRKHQTRPSCQKMPDLPQHRVTPDEPAFSMTGVDYFGPLDTKHGRSTKKRYGVVFTCLNCRAVHNWNSRQPWHLIMYSCNIRRFVARRGRVQQMFSDNRTNFVSANKELRNSFKDLDQDLINKYTTSCGIQWHFNPPAASHQGGVWERQVRTIRKIMNAILNEQNMKTTGSDGQSRTLIMWDRDDN